MFIWNTTLPPEFTSGVEGLRVMGPLNLIPAVDEGLGKSTHLLDLGEGRAPVMDPERDLRHVRSEASRRGLSIAAK
ncbi:hypothetical protein ACQR35_13915 [Pseudarthrobacter sp. J1738]|uniref:hypothetical protein n=1 Tax=unclassified Pseudarthrobacter TaxID=2647000 RepID=UPI003D268B36